MMERGSHGCKLHFPMTFPAFPLPVEHAPTRSQSIRVLFA